MFADDLNRLGRRKAELEREVAAPRDMTIPALLHPRLAQVYRHKIERLLEAFSTECARHEARETVRGLIDAVMLTPRDGVLHAEVKGDLATMLILASGTHQPLEAEASASQQVKLVAGTRTKLKHTLAMARA